MTLMPLTFCDLLLPNQLSQRQVRLDDTALARMGHQALTLQGLDLRRQSRGLATAKQGKQIQACCRTLQTHQ
jgi:hypothetical protein